MNYQDILRETQRYRERQYAFDLLRTQVQFPLRLSRNLELPATNLPFSRNYAYWDCANKTVAVYEQADPKSRPCTVFNASYDIWREKAMSLEHGCFLTKTIQYSRQPECLVSTHLELCRYFDELHEHICAQKSRNAEIDDLNGQALFPSARRLNPLFRALFIVILDPVHAVEESETPVQVVLTGQSEGLQVPIDLSEIQTTDVPQFSETSKIASATTTTFEATTTTLKNALEYIATVQIRHDKATRQIQNGDMDKNEASIPDFEPPFDFDSFLRCRKWTYDGPRITPQLLLDHRDENGRPGFIPCGYKPVYRQVHP
ncbi:hypothetical protein EG328_009324 [Venturia inaequalis]|uniref:Uncharacterized protein n=1 Tax=Venturia inaequalis TaxID=5025 RepID=A0A8H3U9L3_VENIN|nr:hypothetical protein EG328_009324 [Venturia inaequalis]